MKRFFALLCALVLFPLFALADLPDISGLSYEELVALRQSLDSAIWNSAEWKSVEVPPGTYVIGVDIPAGHWTLKPQSGDAILIDYFKEADETGLMPADTYVNHYTESAAAEDGIYADSTDVRQIDIDMKDGWYLQIGLGTCIFEPYVSKPGFNFGF